jgi:hypothetical protein
MSVPEHIIVVNKPIDLVFNNVTCMKGCVNWMTTVMKAEKLGDEPVKVGTQYKQSYKFMGTVGEVVTTIQHYNPPYEFGFVDPSVPLEFHYTFEEVPEGTRVRARLTLVPRGMGNLDPEMVIERSQKQFEIDLNNLKTMLESDIRVQMD